MKNSEFSQKIYLLLLAAYRWYLETPERSLDAAYQAALKIKDIEDEHFNGNKIDRNLSMYSSTVMDYFESDLKKLLKNARMRLTEFKFSRWFSNESHQKAADKVGIEYPSLSSILEKLNSIDQVISKYNNLSDNVDEELNPADLVTKTPKLSVELPDALPVVSKSPVDNPHKKPKRKSDTTGILPRSIFNTINRLQVELDPNSEQNVLQKFRQTKRRTVISVRFILILIIVPLLAHQLSKSLVIGPLVEKFRSSDTGQIFINFEMQEEALAEMEIFAEKIRFENIISNAPPLSSEELEKQMREKVQEVAEDFRHQSANAIKNVFSDIFSVVAFIWILLVSKSSISVLKDFIDNIVYGLSDSAKAFIIILSTDIFVGFHSPHGWEVILEGLSRHWGLPASRDFIFLFIATFPVILDTIFKYWIFRYLNRISPSAVATYHNMNE